MSEYYTYGEMFEILMKHAENLASHYGESKGYTNPKVHGINNLKIYKRAWKANGAPVFERYTRLEGDEMESPDTEKIRLFCIPVSLHRHGYRHDESLRAEIIIEARDENKQVRPLTAAEEMDKSYSAWCKGRADNDPTSFWD